MADNIVWVVNGTIKAQGTYKELQVRKCGCVGSVNFKEPPIHAAATRCWDGAGGEVWMCGCDQEPYVHALF